MPEQSLRFGVRNASGNRASTWKVWTRRGVGKHDVYLTCRSLGGKLKASLHGSGSWHIGFIRAFLDDNLEDSHPKRQDPYIERWPRPAPLAPGVTLAYRIVVPTSGVNVPITDSLSSRIVWIQVAPEGMAIEIDVVFDAHDTVVGHWPGRRSMNTDFVGNLSLENGETVWVVSRIVDVPELRSLSGKLTRFKSGRDVDLAGANIRAIIFGNHEDGSRFMVDCAFETKGEGILP